MKNHPFVRFLTTTLIGGAVFLVPVGMLIWIGWQAVQIMTLVASPLASFFPVDTIGGIALANLVALAAVVLLCFFAGLVARHTIAGPLIKKLDKALINVPGYSVIRGLKSSFDPEETEGMRPVIVQLGTTERYGLEMQEFPDGRSMVYIPSVPNAWTGITQVVPKDQLRSLDIPPMRIIELCENYGHGAVEMLAETGANSGGATND